MNPSLPLTARMGRAALRGVGKSLAWGIPAAASAVYRASQLGWRGGAKALNAIDVFGKGNGWRARNGLPVLQLSPDTWLRGAIIVPNVVKNFDTTSTAINNELTRAYLQGASKISSLSAGVATTSMDTIKNAGDAPREKGVRRMEKTANVGLLGTLADSYSGSIGKGLAMMSLAGGMRASGAFKARAVAGNQAEVLRKVLSEDSVIREAVERDMALRPKIIEGYETLKRFAPSLAGDVNAVRSFLREVVLSGGGVNFATVKTLIDTQRAHVDAVQGGLPKLGSEEGTATLRKAIRHVGFAKIAAPVMGVKDFELSTVLKALGTKLAAQHLQRAAVERGVSALKELQKPFGQR